MTSGCPAFQKHAKHAEGSDTSYVLHTRKALSTECENRNFDRNEKRLRSPAGPRRLGTATRISASLSRRPSAFFGSTHDQAPKAAKYVVLTPGPGMFVNVQLVPRVMIAPPPKTPPISACVPLCAIFLGEPSVYKPQFRQKRKRSRSPAGPRRLGTATRISASLSRRLSVSFRSASDQDPKAAKFAVLTPGHAGFPKRVERSEGSNSAPIRNAPCFAV